MKKYIMKPWEMLYYARKNGLS